MNNSIDLLSINEIPYIMRDRGKQPLARQCYLVACQTKQIKPSNGLTVQWLDTKDELTKERVKPVEDLVAIPLHDRDLQHVVKIGSRLDKDTKQCLAIFLPKNIDIFAWTLTNMLGINFEVMMHHLKVGLNLHLVK